jgi:class 3 adenylate cyclase
LSRRLVAVLFLDLVGWTSLSERIDPEPLQTLLESYYELCSAAVAEQGGEVEKYIGDAVMAVFGTAAAQEDDARRALRAALRIRDGVGALPGPADAGPLRLHGGLAAGEALVTRSSLAGLRVVGDVVNLAARLQAAAAPGQILVNEVVADLVRPAFTLVPLPALTLKGKAEPVPVLLAGAPAQPAGLDPSAADGLMVNRFAERARLREAYRHMAATGTARVVAVRGPLGVGKSRLIREALRDLCAQGAGPSVVVGTCPSYGASAGHTALVQVLDGLTRESASCAAMLRARPHVAAVLESLRAQGDPGRAAAAGPVPGVEEIAWAARELLDTAAQDGPLVLVWDSLEWASPSLLELIGALAAAVEFQPVLTVCATRPELRARDAPWLRDPAGAEVIEVAALDPADSAQLAAALAAARPGGEVQAAELGLADRVADYSAGNPLFIRLMLESSGAGRPLGDLPPTLTAVVGAAIDRLPPGAQALLGAASVIGPCFALDQLRLLGVPAEPADLAVLAERQLVRATPAADEYRFVQQPVHEIAYARLEKELRLAWHRRLAEHEVSPAFHFEAAVRLIDALRPHDPERVGAAGCAARALLGSGTAALRQRDVPTAVDQLERALRFALESADPCGSAAAVRLSDALALTGDLPGAEEVVAAAAARSVGRPVWWTCLIQRQLLTARQGGEPDIGVEVLAAELDAALGHARMLGDVYEEDRLLAARCEVRQWSPTPIAGKLAACADLLERFALDRFLLIPVLAAQARALALTGDGPGAWAALAQAAAAVEQLRVSMGRVLIAQTSGLVCALEENPRDAERHYRTAVETLEQAGLGPAALTLRVQAEREHARLAQPGQALAALEPLLEHRGAMDLRGRLLCLSTAVRLAAEGGQAHRALTEIPTLLAETDDPCLRGEVYFDLARAHRRLGRDAVARRMADAAEHCYETVGATRPLRTVRAWR